MSVRAALSAIMLLIPCAVAAMDFSADMVMNTGGTVINSKVNYAPQKIRMEMAGAGGMISIIRMDRKVVWNLMPMAGAYMEMSLDTMVNKPQLGEKVDGEVERKQVGSETIDGHPTKKYLITYKSGKDTMQMYQWQATDLNLPIRSAALDGSWTQEFRNVKPGKQASELFEIPAGYQKMDMGNIMQGGASGGKMPSAMPKLPEGIKIPGQ